MNVIEVSGLTHRYGRTVALDGVDLSIPEGTVYALLGPNGAGKTTLLHDIMGLQHPSSGAIRIFGKDRKRLTLADRAMIGYVAEGQRLPKWMTLAALEKYLAPMYPTWDVSLARDLGERFHLDPSRKIRTLSRGEHMKAALLCALAPRPKLLVMDEPFTGIDVAVKDDLVRGVLLGAGQEGWTVVISSHDLGELETIADWVGFLDSGSIRFSLPIEEMRERYRGVAQPPSLREVFIALAGESARGPKTEVAS